LIATADAGGIAADGDGVGPAFGLQRLRTLASPELAAALVSAAPPASPFG
jgi:hypothetical protein